MGQLKVVPTVAAVPGLFRLGHGLGRASWRPASFRHAGGRASRAGRADAPVMSFISLASPGATGAEIVKVVGVDNDDTVTRPLRLESFEVRRLVFAVDAHRSGPLRLVIRFGVVDGTTWGRLDVVHVNATADGVRRDAHGSIDGIAVVATVVRDVQTVIAALGGTTCVPPRRLKNPWGDGVPLSPGAGR